MYKFAFAAVAAAIAAGPALADPINGLAPFNGPFVGIQGGWQQDRGRFDTIDNAGVLGTGGRNGSGVGFGVQAGADIRVARSFVIGGEAAFTGRTGGDNFTDGNGDFFRLRPKRTIDITGRVGFVLPSERGGLVYARGGYANARFDLYNNGTRAGFDRDGWTVGGGYEQPLTRHVSARLEYDYSDFGNVGINDPQSPGFATIDGKLHRNAVTAGLNFRF